ncbi:hypothetical protein GCM10023340_39460 [Nocardioides marinquilinus]|uniref:DUF3558 domain-containing protein n=1 Tax=Nocardioides marinquilinus TaxID=1210400 RepID=A0ABP9Q6W2_9ACTN
MRLRTSLTVLGLLATLALSGCGGDDDGDDGGEPTAASAEPVPQTYARTTDGVCETLGLDTATEALGRLVANTPSHEEQARGTTDRCYLDDDPDSATVDADGEVVWPAAVRVVVQVVVRIDGTTPPFDARQFPIWREDGVDAASEPVDGWWTEGVAGTQTLVDDDGTLHGYAASGAVRHDNLEVMVEVTAEHQDDPEPYRAAVTRTLERLLGEVGPQLPRA